MANGFFAVTGMIGAAASFVGIGMTVNGSFSAPKVALIAFCASFVAFAGISTVSIFRDFKLLQHVGWLSIIVGTGVLILLRFGLIVPS